MNPFLLYLLLLKATITSFSGLASLPVLRSDLVLRYHVLTDHQLTTAIAAGRLSPGPVGNYVVAVGYLVDGTAGAIAGWLAMVTPAFLVIPLLKFLGTRADHPRLKGVARAAILAGAALLFTAAVPLARDAIGGPLLAAVAVLSFLLTSFTRVDTLLIVLGAALIGLCAFFV